MVQSTPTQANEPVLDRAFIERERNRFASRALAFLVLLNGAGALILLMVMAPAYQVFRANSVSLNEIRSPLN